MRPGGRRQPKDSFIPPPTPVDFYHRQYPSRDSDASFASSRPSSVGIGGSSTVDVYKNPSYQQSAISAINNFLASENISISFKKSNVPPAKVIHETLKHLLHILELSNPNPNPKFEEELMIILKRLNCPIKITKSIIKSPAVPHQWPAMLALIHWLVQLAEFHRHLSSSPHTLYGDNPVYENMLECYLHFIRGEDNAIEVLDGKIYDEMHRAKDHAIKELDAVKEHVAALEAELETLRSAPSQKELLEKQKVVLEEDVVKFHDLIDELSWRIQKAEKEMAEKEAQLEVKLQENQNICEENEELRKRVELQTFNSRDVERMRKELQAVESDIGEAELDKNNWDEKSWKLDTSLDHKIKDLDALAYDCNQALKRLKISNGIQYQLNPKGTTPAEIMGIDHKLTLKPALNSFADEIKRSSMEKYEESISYQQKCNENAARLERKRNQLAALQSRIDEMEAQMNKLKEETQDYTSKCDAEVKKMLEDVQSEDCDLENMEREAADVLKASELKLQEAIKQSDEEIQIHARELFKLVDSVSKYKEHVGSKISEMKRDLSETATVVSDVYKGSFPAQFGNIFNATPPPGQSN